MDLQQRTLRVGLAAILCALVFRVCAVDLPGWLSRPGGETKENFADTQTGQSVRFSPSFGSFLPDFVETPPPSAYSHREPELPVFTGEEQLQVTYFTSARPRLQQLLVQPLQWDLYGQEPTVLILHTHTTESYANPDGKYRETAAYRTLEEEHNMLFVGSLVADRLQQAGIPVLHDRTVHDYPSYNGAYSHARKTVSQYLEQYPSIRLVLDLHRDASEGSGGQLRTLAVVEEQSSAQLMVVVGTNYSTYPENLSLGLKLHAILERQAPGITRPLQLRGQRFNQDLLPGMLLVEVGAAGNTREEAEAAAGALARGVIALARGTGQPE